MNVNLPSGISFWKGGPTYCVDFEIGGRLNLKEAHALQLVPAWASEDRT